MPGIFVSRKKLAFSLVELLIALIVVSCIIAAFAPVMTKKTKNQLGVSASSDNEYDGILYTRAELIENPLCDHNANANYSVCKFRAPDGVKNVNVIMIGAGGGGGTGYIDTGKRFTKQHELTYQTYDGGSSIRIPNAIHKLTVLEMRGGGGGGGGGFTALGERIPYNDEDCSESYYGSKFLRYDSSSRGGICLMPEFDASCISIPEGCTAACPTASSPTSAVLCNYNAAYNICSGKGMRLPTNTELETYGSKIRTAFPAGPFSNTSPTGSPYDITYVWGKDGYWWYGSKAILASGSEQAGRYMKVYCVSTTIPPKYVNASGGGGGGSFLLAAHDVNIQKLASSITGTRGVNVTASTGFGGNGGTSIPYVSTANLQAGNGQDGTDAEFEIYDIGAAKVVYKLKVSGGKGGKGASYSEAGMGGDNSSVSEPCYYWALSGDPSDYTCHYQVSGYPPYQSKNGENGGYIKSSSSINSSNFQKGGDGGYVIEAPKAPNPNPGLTVSERILTGGAGGTQGNGGSAGNYYGTGGGGASSGASSAATKGGKGADGIVKFSFEYSQGFAGSGGGASPLAHIKNIAVTPHKTYIINLGKPGEGANGGSYELINGRFSYMYNYTPTASTPTSVRFDNFALSLSAPAGHSAHYAQNATSVAPIYTLPLEANGASKTLSANSSITKVKYGDIDVEVNFTNIGSGGGTGATGENLDFDAIGGNGAAGPLSSIPPCGGLNKTSGCNNTTVDGQSKPFSMPGDLLKGSNLGSAGAGGGGGGFSMNSVTFGIPSSGAGGKGGDGQDGFVYIYWKKPKNNL